MATGSEKMEDLIALAKVKTGAGQVAQDLAGMMGPISLVEWLQYWSGKDSRTSPGLSGIGPAHIKYSPGWVNRAFVRLYSACLTLKINPAAWKREQVVPIPKKLGER